MVPMSKNKINFAGEPVSKTNYAGIYGTRWAIYGTTDKLNKT